MIKRWPLCIPFLLALAALAIRCTPPLSSGASSPNYVRLLDVDPPAAAPVIRLSADGNILVLYTATVPGDSVTSIELTEADANGDVLWTKHFGGADNYQAGDVYPLSNGTIAVAGVHTLPSGYGYDVLVLLDANGNVLKNNEYCYWPNLAVTTLLETSSGDIIIGAQSKDPLNTNPNSQLEFLHLSSTGDSLGIALLSGGTTESIQYKITGMSTLDGNSAMGVGTYSAGSTPTRELYSLGADTISPVGFNVLKAGSLRSIVRTGPTSFIVAGDSNNFTPTNDTPWIAAIFSPASAGTEVTPSWTRAISVGANGSITDIIKTADGGLAATGFSATQTGDTSIVVFRFNANGSDVWPYKSLGFSGGDFANAILELSNGDLVIGGITTSFGSRASGARQIFLLHLKADGTPAS